MKSSRASSHFTGGMCLVASSTVFLKRIVLLYKGKILGFIFSKDREIDLKNWKQQFFLPEMKDASGEKLLDY